MTELLAGLGFRRTGRHTGKPVELWEQGDARILLNHGTSTPHSRLRSSGGTPINGTALAAIGLETPDPRSAADRAESVLAPVLPHRRGKADISLDAVAAPDGTELFFCATRRPEHPDWTSHFTPTVGSADGIVTRVDHVALTQPWHHFDEAVLFHRTVLGLRPHESVDLADPYGLFRSRVLSDETGAFRLVLNWAPSPAAETRTRAQHIALATDDITPAVRRIRAAGAELLAIPANYQDDLDARYVFAPGERRPDSPASPAPPTHECAQDEVPALSLPLEPDRVSAVDQPEHHPPGDQHPQPRRHAPPINRHGGRCPDSHHRAGQDGHERPHASALAHRPTPDLARPAKSRTRFNIPTSTVFVPS